MSSYRLQTRIETGEIQKTYGFNHTIIEDTLQEHEDTQQIFRRFYNLAKTLLLVFAGLWVLILITNHKRLWLMFRINRVVWKHSRRANKYAKQIARKQKEIAKIQKQIDLIPEAGKEAMIFLGAEIESLKENQRQINQASQQELLPWVLNLVHQEMYEEATDTANQHMPNHEIHKVIKQRQSEKRREHAIKTIRRIGNNIKVLPSTSLPEDNTADEILTGLKVTDEVITQQQQAEEQAEAERLKALRALNEQSKR